MEDDIHFLQMEDELIFENGRKLNLFLIKANGRQHQCIKWKTTSIFYQLEDDLNYVVKRKTTSII